MRAVLLLLLVPALQGGGIHPADAVPGRASDKEVALHVGKRVLLEEDPERYGPVEIDDFQIVGDKIYVLDSYQSQQAFIFHDDGRRYAFVGGQGDGPGEYRRPGGFCRSGDRLHLTDGSRYQVYDLQGRYLASYPDIVTGGIPRRSHPGPNGTAYYTTYSRYAPDATIYQVSRTGKRLRAFSPVSDDFASFWDMVHPMGLVVVTDTEVLQIFIHRYDIKAFDFTGNLQRNISLASGIYNPPDVAEAKKLGHDKRTWAAFAKKYTLVNHFYRLGDGYVTGLVYSRTSPTREVLEFWDSAFHGLGRCPVAEDEMLVGTHEGRLVFYNADTHALSFHTPTW